MNENVKETKSTTKKVKKILSITFNVIFYLIIVLVLIFSISTISRKNASTVPTFLGKGYLVVQSDSMKGTFEEGELITIKVLKKEKDKKALKVGDVITFYSTKLNALNSHRIVSIATNSEGEVVGYVTKGDNPLAEIDDFAVSVEDVKGVWTGTHSKGWGKTVTFLTSPVGFFVCIIGPTILFLIYAIIMFVKAFMTYRLSQAKTNNEETEQEMKERIIQEYLAKQKENILE